MFNSDGNSTLMEPSQISQTTAPFCPGVAGCPALAVSALLLIFDEVFVGAGVTGLTDSEGLLESAEAVERGNGVIEMLGCWLVLALLEDGVLEL